MRALILDVVSLWPAPLAAIAAILVYDRMSVMGQTRRNRVVRTGSATRSPVAAPLILFTWVALGLALHLAGWEQLPSSAAELQGPTLPDRLVGAEMNIQSEGEVGISGESEVLYEVSPMRSGGSIAPAGSSVLINGGEATVSLTEIPDAGWFGSRGWRVSLSAFPSWGLTIRAPVLEADLTSVRLLSLHVHADGRIRLGVPSGEIPVRLDGDVVLEVPSEASVEVEGPAEVGPGWEMTTTGTRHVGTGNSRFVVVVEPGSILTVEQW